MKPETETKTQKTRWQFAAKVLPWLILFAGCSITYFVWQAAVHAAKINQQNDFAFQAREITTRIEQRLMAYKQILQGTSGLFAASVVVEREDFRDYIAQLRLSDHYPGIQGIGFSQIIPFQKKAGHIDALRQQGFPHYTIFPEGKRDFYTPSIYLEPFIGSNLRAFGYDMYSEPVSRTAMELARDMNEARITGKIRLVQETSPQAPPGFLMFIPIYRNGSTNGTVAERRAHIIGWVYAAFRMNDLMQGLLGERADTIDLEIFDGEKPTPETLMYDWDGQLLSLANVSLYHSSQHFKMFGHPWIINLRSLPALEAPLDVAKSAVIGWAGALLSVLLALLVWQLVSGRIRAIRLAESMTQKLQESKNRMENALTELQYQKYALDQHAIVVTTDVRGTITYVNDQFCQISGYSRDELIGQNPRLINSGTHPKEFFTRMFQTLAAGKVWYGEICNRTQNGSLYWVLSTIVPLMNNQGKPSRYIGIQSDITESKFADARLKEAFHEKELLLKEVYHRVKNNLQIVSSLINLQARNVESEEAKELLRQSADRIKSMALLHEKLYQSKDLAKIDFPDYIQALIDHLMFGYGVQDGRIKVNMNVDELSLDVDTAIPCGLIINELVSNALKYGFPDGRQGEICITFKQEQGMHILVISNNGIDFPVDIDFKKSSSLGLQLANTLSNQLLGSITLDKTVGATFTLRFK